MKHKQPSLWPALELRERLVGRRAACSPVLREACSVALAGRTAHCTSKGLWRAPGASLPLVWSHFQGTRVPRGLAALSWIRSRIQEQEQPISSPQSPMVLPEDTAVPRKEMWQVAS